MTSNDTVDHSGSHRGLLWEHADQPPADIDAIIVPTARPPAYLKEAAALAEALGCTLVTLHSKRWTSAAAGARVVPRSVDLIAIDVPDPAKLRLPAWNTSRLLADTVFARRHTDLSAKRNLGLVLSRLLGWSRILFLDDDITELNPADVRQASGLLNAHSAVGLHVGGFPDNSVVCHAYKQAGGPQQSFIGGGALAVHVGRCTSFFPDIYNDDWFFLLDGDKSLQSVAVTGLARQYPYDPFSVERARAEELGDVLAEGIYWLLDKGRTITDADKAYWDRYLAKRKRFIRQVLGMVMESGLPPDDEVRQTTALKASLGRLALIKSEFCVSYIQAWTADWQQWQRHLQRLTACRDRPSALGELSGKGSPSLTLALGGQAQPTAARPFALNSASLRTQPGSGSTSVSKVLRSTTSTCRLGSGVQPASDHPELATTTASGSAR